MQVLHGHKSPETAYVVEDYPYGFKLRCKIRYWLETAEKGSKQAQTRLMSQTTNPKITTQEVWNKPKGSIYSPFMIMYLDENNYVQQDGLGYYTNTMQFTKFKNNFYTQLNEAQKHYVDKLEKVVFKLNTIQDVVIAS